MGKLGGLKGGAIECLREKLKWVSQGFSEGSNGISGSFMGYVSFTKFHGHIEGLRGFTAGFKGVSGISKGFQGIQGVFREVSWSAHGYFS